MVTTRKKYLDYVHKEIIYSALYMWHVSKGQSDSIVHLYYLLSEIYDVSDQRIELFAGKNFMLECHLFMEEVVEM